MEELRSMQVPGTLSAKSACHNLLICTLLCVDIWSAHGNTAEARTRMTMRIKFVMA